MSSCNDIIHTCKVDPDISPVDIHLDVSTMAPYWLGIRNQTGRIRNLVKLRSQHNQSLVLKVSLESDDVEVVLQPEATNVDSPESLQINKFTVVSHKYYGLLAIDAIYYINLRCRPERHHHITKQLKQIGASDVKVHYIEAVAMSNNPQVGCAMSHMKALADARKNDYDIVLILEDDFTFKVSRHQLDCQLEKLFRRQPNWEVAQLSTVNSRTFPSRIKGISKVIRADTTAGYLVKGRAIIALFNIFLQCCRTSPGMPRMATNQQAIDVAWQTLQPKMNWFLYEPPLGYQSEHFPSDIERFRSVRNLL